MRCNCSNIDFIDRNIYFLAVKVNVFDNPVALLVGNHKTKMIICKGSQILI